MTEAKDHCQFMTSSLCSFAELWGVQGALKEGVGGKEGERGVCVGAELKKHLSSNGPSNCLSPENKPSLDNKGGSELFKAVTLLRSAMQKGWNGVLPRNS